MYFFANFLELEEECAYAGYNQFCENLGGELARWALKYNYSELYRPLKENGESCVVKFKLPFSKIADEDKERIAYKFVIYYAGVYFWNKEYNIEFDSSTLSDVPAKDILEVINYNKEIDY